MGLKIAFVSGCSGKKLLQKLLPLQEVDSVESIDLFTKKEFSSAAFTKIRWVSIPSFLGIIVLQELSRFLIMLLKARQYDVIIGCHQFYHGIWAWLAGTLFGKPVVQVVITDPDLVLSHRIARNALLSANACGVRGPVSEQKVRNAPYERGIVVLHNEYRIPDESQLGVPGAKSKYDIVAVGEYAYDKDYPWMFQIISGLTGKFPSLRMIVVGGGGEYFKKLVEINNLQNYVSIAGFRGEEELAETYRSSRLILMTSRTEGLPMVLVEAMSFGIPVVTSDAGDIRWLVRDCIEGRILRHGDTAGMQDALLRILSDEGLRAELAANARRRIMELGPVFSKGAIACSWKRLIEEAVAVA